MAVKSEKQANYFCKQFIRYNKIQGQTKEQVLEIFNTLLTEVFAENFDKKEKNETK